ncbi:MAG: hypothetical protein M1831_001708 [Alyxoria varia]|nr:MAG: hypothetical protein M1831_001708 [Alyxoria varia]
MAAPQDREPSRQQDKKIFAPAADQYNQGTLHLHDLDPHTPLTQFHTWFDAASSIPQREACTLSTTSLPSGRPTARVVYLKELDARGFVVYSNWGTSRKSADVKSNGQAALTFWWRELERQVRVEGYTERLEKEESQTYFDVRGWGSRIGAWASEQSKVLRPSERGRGSAVGSLGGADVSGEAASAIGDGEGTGEREDVDDGREELEQRARDVESRFEGRDKIPVPDFWGGLRIVPDYVEFWQGRESRLHDRFVYTRDDIGKEEWKIERLSP